MKKMFATAAVGLALSGMAGTGLAAGFATPAAAATPSAVPSASTTTQHPGRTWVRAHRRAVVRQVVQISAKTIGISPKTLVSALRSGQSIAQVAQAHNVDVQTVVGAVVKAGDAKIGQAVDNHKLSQAQGAMIEAALPGVVTKVVNHVFGASNRSGS